MIIMKFGGTSVRNREAIQRVIGIVKGRLPQKPVVVVSALAGVTRLLCTMAEEAGMQHRDNVDGLLSDLRSRHEDLVKELVGENEEISASCLARIDEIIDSLRDFVNGICMIGELSPRSYASIVSTGEVLSSTIVSAAMNAFGISCRLADARKMIVTDCNYMAARPDLEASAMNIRRTMSVEAKGVSVVLTQGFIASSVVGSVSVLGFEGSDFSAAIFGMALGVDKVEIWTDVDGIRSADPRLVPDTVRISKVSYDEASEMAFLGARVLHPLTVEPARRSNIPVVVLNSMNPDCPGTEVTLEGGGLGPKSVAVRDDVAFFRIASRRPVGLTSIMSEVYRAASESRLNVLLTAGSESEVTLTAVYAEGICERFVSLLEERFDVSVFRDKAQISVIGEGVAVSPRVAEALLKSESTVRMTVQSPSLRSSSIVVDKEDIPIAMTRIHSAVFGKK